MSSAVRSLTQSRQGRSLFLLACLIGLVWQLSQWILNDDTQSLIMTGMGVALVIVTMLILKDWRSGFLLFILWLLFEDLARKYLGNSTVLFFGKDVLAGMTYLSLYLAKRKGQAAWFKPPFLVPLGLFFGLALVQVFNPYTPSVLYGLLGLKLYFYYAPLMLVGYALLRNGDDLRQFFLYNAAVGFVIALLGIIQSVVGLSFLNPAHLAPELEELGNLTRTSPLTHLAVPVPDSVFVSGGRFGAYLLVLIVMAMGIQTYVSLTKEGAGRGTYWGFLAVGAALVAAMQSGSRACIIYSSVTIVAIAASFLWGAPTEARQRRRLIKSGRRVILIAAAGLAAMFLLFPDELGAHWAFYSETLSPFSSASQLQQRTWDYPVENLEKAFQHEHWLMGQGTGTASLGIQYITRLVGEKNAVAADVESGYGGLIVEMGILGLILWIAWTFSLVFSAWKIVKQLRGTVYFSLGFSIFWFCLLLLGPLTLGAIGAYQNFIMNAYFWILAGMLFRLPDLARAKQAVPRPSPGLRTAPSPAVAAG